MAVPPTTSTGGTSSPTMRIRDLGYNPGYLPTGPRNSILDVKGVTVGQVTIHEGIEVHKGVTVILPRHPDDIQTPCFAGLHTLNGNGEVTGSYQIKEWGIVNTPICLTNSLSLGIAFDAVWTWILAGARRRGQDERSIGRNFGTPVVGETCDWGLNVIERSALEKRHVMQAFENAKTQDGVQEGSYGGGTGMSCHDFKGGTGTASRVVSGDGKEYTVGVLIQSNYGKTLDLKIGGVPIGRLLAKEMEVGKVRKAEAGRTADGSIVIVVFTDAPLLPTQLQRLAQRAGVGLAQVGGHGVGRTHSGDIFLALSTANRPNEQLVDATPGAYPTMQTYTVNAVKNESMDSMFRAVSEATEEAILNSIVGAREGLTGPDGRYEGLPVKRVAELLKEHLVDV